MQPDISGMVDETQAVEERLEKIETPRSRSDQNDTLWIKNIDLDCGDTSFDTIRISERWRDPETNRVITRFKDESNEYDHREGFTVKWSAQKFIIKPGQTMRMPRFLGEHYASITY